MPSFATTAPARIAGVLCALLIGAATPAGAQTSLSLRHAGQCLAPDPAAGRDALRLEACSATPVQAWRLDGGKLVHLASGACLASDGSFISGTVALGTCDGSFSQGWRVAEGRVVGLNSGLCLTGPAADTGNKLTTQDCRRIDQQLWLTEAGPAAAVAGNVRDVEAGPLFNQREASSRCPAVCAPASWTGRWVTTVPGKMSICGCTADGLAGALLGAEVGVQAVASAIDEAAFAVLMQGVQGEMSSSGKLARMQAAAGSYRFSSAQLRQLLSALDFPGDRVSAIEMFSRRIVDPQNAAVLTNGFDFGSERDRVRRLFDRRP